MAKETMTVGELRQKLEHLNPWTPVYAQCICNLRIIGTSEQTVSGHDDGTLMLALHLEREAVKGLSKAFSQK